MDATKASLLNQCLTGLLIFIMMTRVSSREEITLGTLVNQSDATWEQNGVVILQHQLNFGGALRGFRASFKNTNKLYFQVWHQNDNDANYTLKVEWEYSSITGSGEEMVNLTEFGMVEYCLKPNDLLGFFFPSGQDGPLAYHFILDDASKVVVVGSNFFKTGTKPHLGEIHSMETIGYNNLYSLEYILFRDSVYSAPSTTLQTTATMLLTTLTTKDTHGDNLVIIISVAASVVVVIVVIVLAALCGNQCRNRPIPYKETENSFYGSSMPSDQEGQVREGGANNIHDIVYSIVDYPTLPAEPNRPSSVYVEIQDGQI